MFIFALLVLSCQLAQANWTYIEDDDKSEMTYVDLDTMKLDGDIITVWNYVDFEKPQKGKILSISAKTQFDCKKEMSKELFIALYHQNKLKGKPYARGSVKDKWEEVAPYTMGGKTMRAVCGKNSSSETKETFKGDL